MPLSHSAEPLFPESNPQTRLDCFTLVASADPGVMSRVLELFAKRGLIPSVWHSRLAGDNQDELAIDIQVAGLSPPESRHIAACLRQIPFVGSVLTYDRPVGGAER